MRTKEEATDYRYMPDPDLAPVYVEQAWIDEIRATIPELPDDRKNRFINEFGIPEYDASLITASKPLADFFEAAAKESENVKAVSNWIMGDLMKKLNDTGLEPSDIPFAPGNLSKLISLIDENVISGKIAKQVFEHMWDTGEDPADIVEKKGLKVVTDTEAIRSVVIKVISANPKSVEDYKSGKTKAMGFLIGQIMRETKGKADPQAVNRLLKAELDEL
jgi:aspartyl-tRNA(Asn)/glutamyl-tRNA(Gln) amidotransferase subunit B